MKQINNESPEMIIVEGGTFQRSDLVSVTLSDFFMAKYQVTQGLWESVMGNNPSYFKGDENLPVERVSWYDAVEFCNKLSKKEGLQKVYRIDKDGKNDNMSNESKEDNLKWRVSFNFEANGYRLPTEAEWEYAARGGSLSKGCKYSGSNNAEDVAWYSNNSGEKTHPVGLLQPNELGIYDMSGNVREWCWDWYNIYNSNPEPNPTGSKYGLHRVYRGGSWEDYDVYLQPENRNGFNSNYRDEYLGLRLVRSKYPESQPIINIKPEDLPNMVNVEGGTFQMGSNNGDKNEKPVHSVTLSDFLIAKYAVTQGLWKSVMGNNPSEFTGDDNLPVKNISWYDAVEFCNKLSEREGLQKVYRIDKDRKDPGYRMSDDREWTVRCNFEANGYRLPTEAEWEYAAKGGSLSKGCTYSGSDYADEVAWFEDNSDKKTHPVGLLQPNELGIYDMSGNVLEWCWDEYKDYSSDSQTNPTGPSAGGYRSVRGGRCDSRHRDLRPAYRADFSPVSRDKDTGFRLVRSKYQESRPIIHIKPEDLLKMVNVEGGTFQMGCNNVQAFSKPLHSVTVSDFLICKYAVTQGLWKSVTGNNPSEFTGDDNLPVENISWYDAVEFCNKLSEKEGLQKVYRIYEDQQDPGNQSSDDRKWTVRCDFTANGYRLPTEAEWEYAARGGILSKGFRYSGSDNAYLAAWFDNNSNETHPVGQKEPNELGIYDMSGNVWEWCWDWHGDYSSDSQINPTNDRPYYLSHRVNRGGSWYNGAFGLRPAYRNGNNPDCRDDDLGFRLVRSKYPESRPIIHIKPEDLLKMVNVEGGTFQMGSKDYQISKTAPLHSVTLSDFLIGKYAVTQGLWRSAMGNNPSELTGDDNLPVENVSWYDAVEFCNKLSEREGLQKVYRIDKDQQDPGNQSSDDRKWMVRCDFTANGYRLPTEAEWEYAARGGILSKGFRYSGSDNAYLAAWFDNNSNETHPVGQNEPNELGIYDMSGNVWEWCWDWYGDYSSDSQTNPAGPFEGGYRVNRGGSWDDNAIHLQTVYRGKCGPGSRYNSLGFRLVRSKYPESRPIIHIKPEDLLKMVKVEGGTFQMGSDNGYDNEKPVHRVTLSDFLICKYAVTQGLWKSVTGNNPSELTGDDNLPVENVSWYDAVEFCNKLSEREGLQKVYRIDKDRKDPCNQSSDDRKWRVKCDFEANGYRLPTEAEWEYAARGGILSKGFRYSGSDNAYLAAWFDNNSNETHPVGQNEPNELGIYDMSGNVWEWCWDWYGDYSSDSQTNPEGPFEGSDRVNRGGSWYHGAGDLRPEIRHFINPEWRSCRLGCRLVRSK